MTDDQLITLIQKYLNGNCTPEEKELVEQWYATLNNEERAFYDNDPQRITASAQRSLERIRATVPMKTNRRTAIYRWVAAASVLLLLGAGGWWALKRPVAPAPYSEIVAQAGHVTHITLDDHTAIWLNAGSRLRYRPNDRTVLLDGEAYFEVTTDAANPFQVRTSLLTTKVLGTHFTVTAYPNMPTQQVVVTQGKVQVADSAQVLGILTENRQINYTVDNSQFALADAPAKTAATSWKDGRLEFENQQMEDIAARLGRWYGYSFSFGNNAVAHCRYTASFNNRIALSELMHVMKAISNIDYTIDTTSKTVVITGKGCNQ
jgi:transmembrane sensor